MANIINEDALEKHTIEKFQFASIGEEDTSIKEYKPISFDKAKEEINDKTNQKQETQEASKLLTKIEELTEENVKLQLELETLQKDLEARVKDESKNAYQKGREEGIKETTNTFQEQQDDLKTQLVKSIGTLDEKLYSLDLYLDKIQDSLIDSALLIAKKVIKKEIDKNSKIIAKNIALSFISDLKDAKQITLKVNPQDETYLSEHFSNEKNIKIDPDDAINKGGIIILSDIGNIDGNIETRIQKATNLIKQED
jgi:flagellar assembly protein FliH